MQIPKAACCKQYIAILFLALLCTSTTAKAQIDTNLSKSLQNSINNMLTTYSIKGISAAAYIPGMGMWKGVAGESYAGVPIDTNMLMSMGSITKTFVAAEILKLVDASQLSLTDTVGALLPPIANVNGAITVKQLLHHTSGLGEFNSNWIPTMFANPTATWYFPTAVTAFTDVPLGPPGSPWKYCNTNYSILGMIIEAKKNDSLHRILRNDFITPFHLGNTHMEVFEHYPNAIAHNWITATLNPALAVDSSSTPHQAMWSSVEPQGGYFSDAADLARWGYNLYSGKVLSATSLANMLTFTNVTSSYFNGYGLGAMRFSANGRGYYGHAGNYYGYAASMLYHPQDSICVAVLINQDCIATYEARALINDLLNITTGIIENTLKDNIIINPNPANTTLTISIPGKGKNMHLSIIDIFGNEVYKTGISTGTVTINTTGFNTGTYFIKITNGNATLAKQIMIQH